MAMTSASPMTKKDTMTSAPMTLITSLQNISDPIQKNVKKLYMKSIIIITDIKHLKSLYVYFIQTFL